MIFREERKENKKRKKKKRNDKYKYTLNRIIQETRFFESWYHRYIYTPLYIQFKKERKEGITREREREREKKNSTLAFVL